MMARRLQRSAASSLRATSTASAASATVRPFAPTTATTEAARLFARRALRSNSTAASWPVRSVPSTITTSQWRDISAKISTQRASISARFPSASSAADLGERQAAAAALVVEIEPGLHQRHHGVRRGVVAVDHGLEEADPVRVPVQRVRQPQRYERLAGARGGRADVDSFGHGPPFAVKWCCFPPSLLSLAGDRRARTAFLPFWAVSFSAAPTGLRRQLHTPAGS